MFTATYVNQILMPAIIISNLDSIQQHYQLSFSVLCIQQQLQQITPFTIIIIISILPHIKICNIKMIEITKKSELRRENKFRRRLCLAPDSI